jgi:hypothetical protein
VLFLAGYFFTETLKYWVPGQFRIYTYLAMVAVMYSIIFALIAPKKPVELAKMHLVSFKIIIVFLGVVLIPYTAGWAYKTFNK